eukprot:symbB.v1.2.004285.t1/scaffold220.1/size262620/9
MGHPERKFIFQRLVFRGYVSFRDGNLSTLKAIVTFFWQSNGGLIKSASGGSVADAAAFASSHGVAISRVPLGAYVGSFQVCLLACLCLLKRRHGLKWQGANVTALIPCMAVGWTLRFVCPIPAGVTEQAWSMLSIFVSMILGVVLGPLPTAATTVVAMSVVVVTGTATLAQGLKAFTEEVVWLVLIAFFLADGFHKTGLGDRIALNVIRVVGGTTLGLAYGLNFAELVVAAAMPCSAARAAAMFYPITKSVCKASGSDPNEACFERKIYVNSQPRRSLTREPSRSVANSSWSVATRQLQLLHACSLRAQHKTTLC